MNESDESKSSSPPSPRDSDSRHPLTDELSSATDVNARPQTEGKVTPQTVARIGSKSIAPSESLLERLIASGGKQGAIPTLRMEKGFHRFVRRAGADPRFVEQVHRLRESIILSALRDKKTDGGLILGLMGPNGGEGTSAVSVLLGLALAECGTRKVGILDGRLNTSRFQAIADLLGLSRNALTVEKNGTQVAGYCNSEHPNLYFLRSHAPEPSVQFFSDKKLAQFLGELRHHFDFVLIDLPPMLRDTTTVFVLPHLDRIYLVAEAGKTRLAELRQSKALATEAQVKLGGVIVNKVQAPWWARFYGGETFR